MSKSDEQVIPYTSSGITGLTKRELFAAMAMQGILSGRLSIVQNPPLTSELVAEGAVGMADALLEELAKGEGR